MNILFILPYSYINGVATNWKTGFGIYTTQLAEELAKKPGNNVFVLSLRQRFQKDFSIKGVTYIGLSDIEVVKALLNSNVFKSIVNITKNNYYKQSFRRKILTAAYVTGKSNCLYKIINDYNIDFVHIHSLAQELYTIFHLKILKPENTLITVHSSYIDNPKYGNYNNYFSAITKMLLKKKFNLTFVSTGVKNDFIRKTKFSKDINKRMHVILNGTVMPTDKTKKVKNKERKVLLCVGTICEHKNQIQLLDALSNLTKIERNSVIVYVIGNDGTNGEFDNLIKKRELQDVIIKTGFVRPEEMYDYYKNADGNILLSRQEAFGLSIIEAFQFGVPTLCFSDIGAARDIYNDCAVLFFEDRRNESVTKGIKDFLKKDWNVNDIKEWGEKFQLKEISDQYYRLYYNIIDKSGLFEDGYNERYH